MNKVILLVLICCSLQASEIARSSLAPPSRQTSASGSIDYFSIQALDESGTYSNYTINYCIGPPEPIGPPSTTLTEACPTGIAGALTANCSASGICGAENHANFIPPATTTGGVTPRDGNQHTVAFWQVSQGGGADIPVDFSPQPFRWDAANNNLFPDFSATVTQSTPLTFIQLGTLIDTRQSYSTGTNAGNLVCASNGTNLTANIYDNGGPGYWATAHAAAAGKSVDCSLFYTVAIGLSDYITWANYTSIVGPALSYFWSSTSVQGVQAGWLAPSIIVGAAGNGGIAPFQPGGTSAGYALTGVIAMYPTIGTTEPASTNCIHRTYPSGFVTSNSWNPWHNSGNDSNPRGSGFWLSGMLAAATCPGCQTANNFGKQFVADFKNFKSIVDASIANVATNPTTYSEIAFTTNSGRYYEAASVAPSILGNVLSANNTYAIAGSYAAPAGQDVSSIPQSSNLLLFVQGSDKYNFTSAMNFTPGGGMVMNYTSFAQAYLANGSGQTPLAAFMGSGTVANSMNTGIPAVASFATVCEPCESIVYKEPDPALYTYYVTHGFTVLQAAWKSARYPWELGFVGEPLAQVYPRMRRFRGGAVLNENLRFAEVPIQ